MRNGADKEPVHAGIVESLGLENGLFYADFQSTSRKVECLV